MTYRNAMLVELGRADCMLRCHDKLAALAYLELAAVAADYGSMGRELNHINYAIRLVQGQIKGQLGVA